VEFLSMRSFSNSKPFRDSSAFYLCVSFPSVQRGQDSELNALRVSQFNSPTDKSLISGQNTSELAALGSIMAELLRSFEIKGRIKKVKENLNHFDRDAGYALGNESQVIALRAFRKLKSLRNRQVRLNFEC
jgi:hypothetical protein